MSVYANGRAIVHKGDGNRQISGTPDVCKTPSPGGPVPVPYSNIASDTDLAKGSKRVKVEGNPAALQSSNLKTSTGDEAGTAGGGVISSKTKGKVTWASSSSDVRIEGKNSIRYVDICLHNGNMSQAGVQGADGEKVDDDDEEDYDCLHCGLKLSDPSHNHARIDTGDRKLMNQALEQQPRYNVVGGIKTATAEIYDTTVLAKTGAGKTPPFIELRNLASGKPLAIGIEEKKRWSQAAPRNTVGNCVEQVLLDRAFPVDSPVKYRKDTKISMGVASKKEKPKPKCAICEEVIVAMLCTNVKPTQG